MHFEIEVNGKPHLVTVERTGSRFRVEADGRVDVVDVAPVDGSTWSLLLDGDRACSHEVSLVDGREPGEVSVYLRAGVVHTRVMGAPGQRRWNRPGSAPAGAAGPQRITAPMPGKVVKVLVAPGESVEERQGLVVVEAMKMENELRAPRAGRVREVHVQEGAPVESGRLLVVLE